MDPVSAFSLGCSVLDLVSMAIDCCLTVKQVYDSGVGLTKAHETVQTQATRMNEVVDFLRDKQFQIEATGDDEIKKIAGRCATTSEKLRGILDDCRAKHKSILAAGESLIKSYRNRDRISDLQQELKACRGDLHSFISIATRDDVAKILRILKTAGIGDKSEIVTSLNKMDDRLKEATLGSAAGEETFQEALEMVNNGIILETLHSEILGRRFDEIGPEHKGTFDWIFNDPKMVFSREEKLTVSFPAWLETGSGIFHIAGKPGSGKSTLMKYLCNHEKTQVLLEKWARDSNRQLLQAKFFFWRIGSSHEQKSLHGLIRGLLYEVLCNAPTLARFLFPDHWKRASKDVREIRSIRIGSDDIMQAFDRLVGGSATSDQTTLLKQVRICLFIDGLDEFETARDGPIKTHGQLAEQLQSWAGDSDGNVKICVSSRIEAPFIDNFPIEQCLTLNNLTTQDIERIVRGELGEHKKFKLLKEEHSEECEALLKQIISDTNGVFLWVTLLLQDLCQGLEGGDKLDMLKERVASTPQELSLFLEQILKRVQPVYRQGVYLLLAIVLRTTGHLLSTEPRSMEYAIYDTLDFPYGWNFPRMKEFNLSTLSCFSILWVSQVSHKEMAMKLDFELSHLDFLNHSSQSYTDKKARSAIIAARCNGLLEIFDDKYVKFMHRSIPEFLQDFFRQHYESHRLDDYKITEAMAWAYLVEVKYLAAQTLNAGPVTEDVPLVKNPSAEMLLVFLCRVRQIRLEENCEPIFRLLLAIEQTMQNHPDQWPRAPTILEDVDHTESQSWSLLYLSVLIGLHEFISWTFRQPQRSTGDLDLFNMASSAVTAFHQQRGTVHSVRMLETLFENGIPADIVYPVGCHRNLPGKPLWHALLLHLPYGYLPSTWEAIELWLKKGANAEVSLEFDYGDTWAKDARDGSGVINMSDLRESGTSVIFSYEMDALYQALDRQRGYQQYRKVLGLELQDLVKLMHPPNERELLGLIDSQAVKIRTGNASSDKQLTLTEFSEVSNQNIDKPASILAITNEKSTRRLQQSWAKMLGWTYIRFALMGVIGFILIWSFT